MLNLVMVNISKFKEKYFWNKELSFFDNISSRVTYLLLLVLFLFFINLGKRDLWAPDEPRYAEVAREMRDLGDFVLPHLNYEKYPDKPPVLFWLINIFSIPFGEITELSARMPAAFAGIGCVLLIYFLGRRLFLRSSIKNPHRIAFLAGIILATSLEYTVASRRVAFDVLLTFLVTLALSCFYTGYIRNKGKTRFFFLSYLIMSVATITKGPVGLLLPILTIAVFLTMEKLRNRNYSFRLRDMRIGWGILILFSIPLLWIAALYSVAGREHTIAVVFTQNTGRAVNSWSHNQPFYYFLVNFPLRFLPWSLFIPAVVIYYLKVIKNNCNKLSGVKLTENQNSIASGSSDNESEHFDVRSTLRFPFAWFVTVFIFFSIMSGKRTTYLLPLYPAAALFVAWFINALISNPKDKTLNKSGYITFMFVYSILFILGIGIAVYVFNYQNEWFNSIIPLIIVYNCGILVSFRYLLCANYLKLLLSSLIIFLLIMFIGTQFVIPLLNEKKSAKEFCLKTNLVTGEDGKLSFFKYFGSTYLFYTGRKQIREINEIEVLKDYLATDEQVFFIVKAGTLENIREKYSIKVYDLIETSVGHRTLILASNKQMNHDVDWGLINSDTSGND